MSYRDRMNRRDTFEAQIYSGPNLFLIPEWGARAKPGDWVITERLEDGEIQIQRYTNQSHLGVARILEFYALQHSEQWTPAQRPMPY